MRILKVKSLPLKNVIMNIAKELNTDFSMNCGIYQVIVPEDVGSGHITGVDFDDGLGLVRYDCTFLEDVDLDFSVDTVHPVKFLFCGEGMIGHRFKDEDVWHGIPEQKNAIVASSSHHGHVIRFSQGKRTVFGSLELDRRRFQPKISCKPISLFRNWINMLNDVTAKRTFYHEGFYSFRLGKLFEEWDLFTDSGFLRKLHLEGLAYRILVFQIAQFQDDIKSEGRKTILRQVEIKQIEKALEIIEYRLEDLPTITMIAREIGLNPNKLQQGFKELFNMTVNEFITDKRMDTARLLLKNGDMTLSYISARIGYNNPSYLSKIFFRSYGMTPSDYRKRHRADALIPHSLINH